MRRLHYVIWSGWALLAFMIIPVIKAQDEVIEKLTLAKIYSHMSMIQLSEQDL